MVAATVRARPLPARSPIGPQAYGAGDGTSGLWGLRRCACICCFLQGPINLHMYTFAYLSQSNAAPGGVLYTDGEVGHLGGVLYTDGEVGHLGGSCTLMGR